MRSDQEFVHAQLALLAESVELMREFCRRVDAGEVRSRKTYAQFKVFIAKYEESQNV